MAAFPNAEAIKRQILDAFSTVDYPGDWCLRRSNEGEEPFLLEREFQGQKDWKTMDPNFLDNAPSGFSSALSFLSDEAFRFYLPAYLLADLDGKLERVDLVFYLCGSLMDTRRNVPVNWKRYGPRTWFDEARYRFSVFTGPQVRAIVAYLRFRHSTEELPEPRNEIDDALRNYWLIRSDELGEE